MKIYLVVVISVVLMLVLSFGLVSWLGSSAEGKAAESFASMAPDEELAVRYPLISAKNDVAETLEQSVAPLAISVRPRNEGAGGVELDATIRTQLTDWLKAQHERPDDVITPLPPELGAWLRAHSGGIDSVAELLASGTPPRWVQADGPAIERLTRPLPNLIGHMQLFRVFSVAALDRKSKGDNDGAWVLLHAADTLSRGLLERREMISQLIAVAGVRMTAATARKLDPPMPAWFAELSKRSHYRAMFGAIRFETAMFSEAVKDPGWVEHVREEAGEGAGFVSIAGTMASRPLLRWAAAENVRAVGAGLSTMDKADPCSIDSEKIDAQVASAVPEFFRGVGAGLPSALARSLSRAANADVTIEGTTKILALKAARNGSPAKAWPAAFTAEQSALCSGARWKYSLTPEGQPSLRFTGRVDFPRDFQGAKIPLEWRGESQKAEGIRQK